MIKVTFVKGWTPFNAGEIASFEDDVAKDLIRRGIATPFDAPKPETIQAAAVLEAPEAHKDIVSPSKVKSKWR